MILEWSSVHHKGHGLNIQQHSVFLPHKWEGSGESSVGWSICFSKPGWCVDTASKPWLSSSTTMENYLLFNPPLGEVLISVLRKLKGAWARPCESTETSPTPQTCLLLDGREGFCWIWWAYGKNLFYFMLHWEDFKWRFGCLTVQFQTFY